MKKYNFRQNLTINTKFNITPINTPKTPSSITPKTTPNTQLITKKNKNFFDAKKIYHDYDTNGELWLGDYEDSLYAFENGINIVINVAYECKTPCTSENYNEYLHYNIKDSNRQETIFVTDEIPKKINIYLKNGNKILVHCKKGISRSATCIIAFLIKYNNLKHYDAFNHVLNIKNDISPNFNFIEALETLEH
jgi:protein-tyrosine phosphatase